jgi:hypothetical protein
VKNVFLHFFTHYRLRPRSSTPENLMLKKFFLPFLLFLIAVPLSAQTVTLSSLLSEMIDRDAITRFPEPAYVCLQASSYDRASVAPDKPGWFANHDTAQFIREETNGNRKEWVLMDAEGPGAIVRWWITAPHYRTTVRIYFDGSNTPAIEAPIDKLIGGDHLVGAPLSAEKARGRNLYLPIPYAKHCKVTVDNMPDQGNLYYIINYRTYATGTNVETFTMENFNSLKAKIDSVQKTLLDAGEVYVRYIRMPSNIIVRKGGVTTPLTISEIPPTPTSGGALSMLLLKFDIEGEELAQALRSTVISIKFDDKETVWCPLGDFFGSGVGANPYKSWYSRVEKNGTMVSYWIMPFKKEVKVSLTNYGDRDFRIVLLNANTSEYKWTDRSMYFHADWRQERNIETVAGNGTKDWNYIKLKGRGVFVGDVLSVLNRNPAWWGEGDEKIYVDGEGIPIPEGGKGVLPSHFGTGTEDYYGYAWCTPEFFEAPFHFQPRAEGPANYGHATNGRVRSLDAIPFTKSFHFDMEVWHWAKTKIDYSVVNFWYGFAETELVDFQKREDQITEVKSPVLYHTPMSLEIPGFKIEKIPTVGNIQNQTLHQFTQEGRKWENDDQLWWTGGRPGAKLELILEVDKEGKYKLVGELTKARDYAIIQFRVNGEKVDAAIDLYNPEVIPTGALEIGSLDLKAGKHIVEIEIVGKNERADAGYMVGIDQLRLMP